MASFSTRLPATGGTVEFRANGTTTVILDRTNFYRALLLRLACAPTVAAVDNTAANTGQGDEWALVDRIRLKVGSTIMREVTGPELRRMNAFLHGITPRVNPLLADAATANPFIWSQLLLPIFPPFMVSPYQFSMNAPSFTNELTLEIKWNNFDAINSAATGFTTNPTLNVEVEWNNGPIESYISSQLLYIPSVPATTLVGGYRLPTDEAIRGVWMHNRTTTGLDSPFVFGTAATVDDLVKLRTASVPVQEVELAKIMDETRQLSIQTFTPRNDSESDNAHVWLDILNERPGFASEALPTVTFLPDGSRRALDQVFLTFESLAQFTNATDVVDLYLWRVPNPAAPVAA